MDHSALTTLRTALATLQHSPTHTTHLRAAQQALTSLPPLETLRELRRLPSTPTRISLISLLLSVPSQAHLRLALLRDDTLLPPPPISSPTRAALTDLTTTWRPLCTTRPASTLLDHLITTHNLSRPSTPTPPSLPLDSLRSSMSALTAALSAHEATLAQAEALCDADATGHDGLQEAVRATWGQVRLRRTRLSELRRRVVDVLAGEIADAAALTELLGEVDEAVCRLHARRMQLVDAGFEVGNVTPGQSSSEDEWEDAVDLGEDGETGADEDEMQSNGEGNRRQVEGDVTETPLPVVNDWAAVMRGDGGRETNRLILERFESRAQAASSEGNGSAVVGLQSGSGSNSALGRRGGRAEKRKGSTAKDRLSKKLGIRKRRGKKLASRQSG